MSSGGDAARLGRADVSDQLLRVVQTLGGVAIIFAVERSVWALGIYMGRSIPSAPVGMMLVFFALVAADVLAPHLTAKVMVWFGPAIAALLHFVPVLFAPPLVQMPLALAHIPTSSLLCMLGVVVSGSIVGCLATGAAVNMVWGFRGGKVDPNTLSTQKQSKESKRIGALPIARASAGIAVVVCCAVALAFASGRQSDALLIVLVSCASLELGNALPARIKRFIPAVVTSAGVTSAAVSSLGRCRGQTALEALAGYRTGKGSGFLGVYGEAAVGDRIFVGAPAVIVGLGVRAADSSSEAARASSVRLRHQLRFVSSLDSVFMPAFAVEGVVARSLVSRFVTLPMAVPVTEALQGSVPLATLAASLQAILAATICLHLLDGMHVHGRLARGIALGGNAHALGTAAAAVDEPCIASLAALAFLLCGTIMSLLVQVQPLARAVMFLLP
eukprot:CAMPEP_0179414924 /NCGR_PEP_ID=MMETSP0799-20121207/5947_1 /TAXON_ID=46947 /ORGANISM="Geminigera cryophila, Strain CCMP2564" /LENGTH=444 /DNA_ID=CAMNT_0021187607 /DNA_START=308 /DNA_END=1644 /DNA_ORIENTATION=+